MLFLGCLCSFKTPSIASLTQFLGEKSQISCSKRQFLGNCAYFQLRYIKFARFSLISFVNFVRIFFQIRSSRPQFCYYLSFHPFFETYFRKAAPLIPTKMKVESWYFMPGKSDPCPRPPIGRPLDKLLAYMTKEMSTLLAASVKLVV
jgi:hypothetical protein